MKKLREKEISREIHRLFWRANFQSKKNLAIGYVGRITATAIYYVFIPLIAAYGVQAILTRQFDIVSLYAWWIIGLSFAYALFWCIGGIGFSKVALKGDIFIRNTLFSNFLHKDYDFYSDNFFGSLGAQAARFYDAYGRYGEIVEIFIPRQVTTIIAGVGVIAYHSPQLALVTIVSMVFVLGFTFLSTSWRLKFRRRASELSSKVSGEIGDALSHGTTVKSFAMEDSERERLQFSLKKWGEAQYKAWTSSLPADAGRMILAGIATAILLLLSASLYEENAITITIVVLIQLYVIRLVASTLEISETVKSYEETMSSAYQAMTTMLIPSAVNDPVSPKNLSRHSSHTLKLSNISFHYLEAAKNQMAVNNFTLHVKPGEKIGVVGYSGSGKTTLTKLLLRFMDVTKGKISLNDIDIRDITQANLRNIISYVPQEPLLFHRSILENIAYGKPNATKKEIFKVAKLAYIDEFLSELPKGYDTLVGERGVKLSGGQRQRVAIARALLKNSPILVLDEATSALDSKSEKYIQDALWKLMKDRTAIIIAHRLSTIQRMDRIIVMNKGEIVQEGTHRQLKNQPGIYADLWEHQSGGYIGIPTSED